MYALGLLLFGGAIGVLSGVLGIGGGVILVPGLMLLFGFSQPEAQGTSLAVMIRGKAIKGEKLYQFVIDGENHPALLTDGWLRGNFMAVKRPMSSIAYALVEARSNAFTVEVPDLKISEQFSLLNVRDALNAKDIAECGDR